jgi:ubiquinone/menaquinone biosynthesis C-methylase UbiE
MTQKWRDPSYLSENQYRNQDNLQARIFLHQTFTQAEEDWFSWVWRMMNIQSGEHILEVGCGTGALWQSIANKLPAAVRVTLADLSVGMARGARENIQAMPQLSALSANAQNLPFVSARFQRVIANHMLYHVPNLDAALAEMRRVLTPGGWLIAATNGADHMLDLYELMSHHAAAETHITPVHLDFDLENGVPALARHFDQVECVEYQSSLWVTDADALTAYCASMLGFQFCASVDLQGLHAEAASLIKQDGGIRIRKAVGLLKAR